MSEPIKFTAIAEATVFLGYFNDLPDRRQSGKVVYPLNEVLLLSLLERVLLRLNRSAALGS